jgi:hypothetical protein
VDLVGAEHLDVRQEARAPRRIGARDGEGERHAGEW